MIPPPLKVVVVAVVVVYIYVLIEKEKCKKMDLWSTIKRFDFDSPIHQSHAVVQTTVDI